jgi:hypothetical protein
MGTRGERISPFSFVWTTRNGVGQKSGYRAADLLQRKKRIFGFPGIIAPVTTSTTITITSSIFSSPCCPHNQAASAQLTSYCTEGKLLKCRRAIKEGNTGSVNRFWEADSEGNFGISVGKDLGRESFDGSGLAPGIQRQTSFTAGLLQKSFPVPTMFDGNLGQ